MRGRDTPKDPPEVGRVGQDVIRLGEWAMRIRKRGLRRRPIAYPSNGEASTLCVRLRPRG